MLNYLIQTGVTPLKGKKAINGRVINNINYADDTVILACSQQVLRRPTESVIVELGAYF